MAAEAQEQVLGIADVTRIVRRRRWWLIAPALAGLLGAVVLAFTLPAEYEAAATVVVEGEGISPELARSTVSAPAETRYGQLRLRIMARDKLGPLIDRFGLFAGHTALREELIERLRERIIIEPLPPAIVDPRKPVELNSFRIAFRWPDPARAAAVANRLANDFVAENLRDRTSVAEGASSFITAELEKTRAQLSEVAQKISVYKQQNLDELPEQLALNQQRLELARRSLSDAETKLETARSQVGHLRSAIEELRLASSSREENPVLRKQALELQLHNLLSRGMTEKHPDVVASRAEIAALEGVIDDRKTNPGPISHDELRLREQLRDYEVQAGVYAREVERNKADIAKYERYLAATPARAAELAHLVNTYDNLNEALRGLQLKKVEADMGRALELSNKGEQFSIVESAQPPTAPVRPNRPLVIVAGLALGMLTGFGLLVLRELTDTSFHSVQDLQKAVGLPVLAVVPVIEPPAAPRRRAGLLGRLGRRAAALALALGLGAGAAAGPAASACPAQPVGAAGGAADV
jgi:polysaccharide chain length determinant protein (PEP-CTERM system associated)